MLAEECGLPMAYEGGIEVFRTDAAKLLLAWFRILERDADRGWALVLEKQAIQSTGQRQSLKTRRIRRMMIGFGRATA